MIYKEKDITNRKEAILKTIPKIEEIILFGSYARGDQSEKSDMDFLVLTTEAIKRKDKLNFLAKIRWESIKNDFTHLPKIPSTQLITTYTSKISSSFVLSNPF